MNIIAQELKEKIKQKKVTVGTWMQISNASMAEILSRSGYDWVVIDLEHGAFSVGDLPELVNAISKGGAVPFVRLSSCSKAEIKTALDSGVRGLIFPMIESAKQLKDYIKEAQYPPDGIRGIGFSIANGYGDYFDEYFDTINKSLIFVAQIESYNAITNLSEIANVDEIDALMIGPYDLSGSMGCVGNFENEEFKKALITYKNKCEENNKPFGLHIVEPDLEVLKQKIEDGNTFIAYSLDGVLISRKASEIKKIWSKK